MASRPRPTEPRIRRRSGPGFRPACSLHGRARTPAVFEKTARRHMANVAAVNSTNGRMTMLKQLTNVQVWVHDQDEALAFYTEKLGLELRDDVTVPEMGNFRWLTVGVPGQSDV